MELLYGLLAFSNQSKNPSFHIPKTLYQTKPLALLALLTMLNVKTLRNHSFKRELEKSGIRGFLYIHASFSSSKKIDSIST